MGIRVDRTSKHRSGKNPLAVKDVLPNTLPALLLLAAKSVAKLEKDDRYIIDMSGPHHRAGLFPGKPCRINLAGAVMATALKASDRQLLGPDDYIPNIARKLKSLDSAMVGNMWGALTMLGNSPVDFQTCRKLIREIAGDPWPAYINRPLEFKEALCQFADALEFECVAVSNEDSS